MTDAASGHNECRDVGGCAPDCPWAAYPVRGRLKPDGEMHGHAARRLADAAPELPQCGPEDYWPEEEITAAARAIEEMDLPGGITFNEGTSYRIALVALAAAAQARNLQRGH